MQIRRPLNDGRPIDATAVATEKHRKTQRKTQTYTHIQRPKTMWSVLFSVVQCSSVAIILRRKERIDVVERFSASEAARVRAGDTHGSVRAVLRPAVRAR